jgi:hypothetical protein
MIALLVLPVFIVVVEVRLSVGRVELATIALPNQFHPQATHALLERILWQRTWLTPRSAPTVLQVLIVLEG